MYFQVNCSDSSIYRPDTVLRFKRLRTHVFSVWSKKFAVEGESWIQKKAIMPTIQVMIPSRIKLYLSVKSSLRLLPYLHPPPTIQSSNSFHVVDTICQETAEGSGGTRGAEKHALTQS